MRHYSTLIDSFEEENRCDLYCRTGTITQNSGDKNKKMQTLSVEGIEAAEKPH